MKINRLMSTLAILSGVSSAVADRMPADENATSEAVQLLQRMEGLMERGIMFGHQDDTVYGHDWKYDGVSDVKQVTGDYPAVFGWELGNVELGKDENLDGVAFAKIREQMEWVHANGGINTISWHGANALTGGDTWDNSSDQVVKSILPGGDKEAEFLDQLDHLATFLLSPRTADGNPVPMIFRPYHEHTGSWFWWGQRLCTKDEYIALWEHTFVVLRSKGVHNLIVAYSAAGDFETEEEYLERYPDNGLIDIIGFDTYQRGVRDKDRYVAAVKRGMDIVVPIGAAKDKIVIFAETGDESVGDPNWWTGTLWETIKDYPLSYVLCWRNAHDRPEHFYVPFVGQASEGDFKKFESKKRVLFLKDVQD